MNIAIIASGGDGSGMNECLYAFCSSVKNHNIIMFNRGLEGIIQNDVAHFSLEQLKNERHKGGIIIKTSRSQNFLTDKGFNKCLKTLKNHQIDVLVVMGGNGSLKATKKLIKAGVRCVFIPASIDNDVEPSDYCIGYSTAVENAVDFVNKVNTSMRSFDRICIYEVMGRHCPDIAVTTQKLTNACCCVTEQTKKQEVLKAVKKELKTNSAPIVILQENTTDIDELRDYLSVNLKNKEIKTEIVGYVQRGGDANKTDMLMSRSFAKTALKCINSNIFNVMIAYNQRDNTFDCIEINR